MFFENFEINISISGPKVYESGVVAVNLYGLHLLLRKVTLNVKTHISETTDSLKKIEPSRFPTTNIAVFQSIKS